MIGFLVVLFALAQAVKIPFCASDYTPYENDLRKLSLEAATAVRAKYLFSNKKIKRKVSLVEYHRDRDAFKIRPSRLDSLEFCIKTARKIRFILLNLDSFSGFEFPNDVLFPVRQLTPFGKPIFDFYTSSWKLASLFDQSFLIKATFMLFVKYISAKELGKKVQHMWCNGRLRMINYSFGPDTAPLIYVPKNTFSEDYIKFLGENVVPKNTFIIRSFKSTSIIYEVEDQTANSELPSPAFMFDTPEFFFEELKGVLKSCIGDDGIFKLIYIYLATFKSLFKKWYALEMFNLQQSFQNFLLYAWNESQANAIFKNLLSEFKS